MDLTCLYLMYVFELKKFQLPNTPKNKMHFQHRTVDIPRFLRITLVCKSTIGVLFPCIFPSHRPINYLSIPWPCGTLKTKLM